MPGCTAHTGGSTLALAGKDLLSRLSLTAFEHLEDFVLCLQDYGFLVLHKRLFLPPPASPYAYCTPVGGVGFFCACFSLCPVLDFFFSPDTCCIWNSALPPRQNSSYCFFSCVLS